LCGRSVLLLALALAVALILALAGFILALAGFVLALAGSRLLARGFLSLRSVCISLFEGSFTCAWWHFRSRHADLYRDRKIVGMVKTRWDVFVADVQ